MKSTRRVDDRRLSLSTGRSQLLTRCERGHTGVPQRAWQAQVYRHDPDEPEYARRGPMEHQTGQERRNRDHPKGQRPARLGGPGDDTAAARRLPQAAQPAVDGARASRRGRRGPRRETEDSATVTIKPGWGFSADYRPGQYVGIGLRVDGRWHWRSYSLTSVPVRDKKRITITVKATPEGLSVLAPGQRRNAGNDRSAWRRPRATSRCPTRRRRRFCSSVPAAASPR